MADEKSQIGKIAYLPMSSVSPFFFFLFFFFRGHTVSHVDHMRFSCLPAALEMDILMAFRVQTAAEGGSEGVSSASSSKSHDSIVFHIGNTAERFQKATFESAIAHSSSVQLEHDGPTRWANYFKVAFKVRSSSEWVSSYFSRKKTTDICARSHYHS